MWLKSSASRHTRLRHSAVNSRIRFDLSQVFGHALALERQLHEPGFDEIASLPIPAALNFEVRGPGACGGVQVLVQCDVQAGIAVLAAEDLVARRRSDRAHAPAPAAHDGCAASPRLAPWPRWSLAPAAPVDRQASAGGVRRPDLTALRPEAPVRASRRLAPFRSGQGGVVAEQCLLSVENLAMLAKGSRSVTSHWSTTWRPRAGATRKSWACSPRRSPCASAPTRSR